MTFPEKKNPKMLVYQSQIELYPVTKRGLIVFHNVLKY